MGKAQKIYLVIMIDFHQEFQNISPYIWLFYNFFRPFLSLLIHTYNRFIHNYHFGLEIIAIYFGATL